MKGKNKIGTVFFVSMLALAGVGVSFAALTDIITISGSVTTGTVEFDFDYTGTYVWKHIDSHGMVETNTPDNPDPANPDDYLLVAWAYAYSGGEEDDYDIYMEWNNIFPGPEFSAVIDAHYIGTIPVHVTFSEPEWIEEDTDQELLDLFVNPEYFNFYPYFVLGNKVPDIVQMHNCDHLFINITIQIPQQDDLKGKSGVFGFNINAVQWNDCDEPNGTPEGQIRVIKETDPAGGTGFEFTVIGPNGYTYDDTLDDGEDFIISGLADGTYTITETVPEGWTLKSIEITGNYDNDVIDFPEIRFELEEDGAVFVTFTNEEEGKSPLSLPDTAYCTFTHWGQESYFDVKLTDLNPTPPSDGYSWPIADGATLVGWCVDEGNYISNGYASFNDTFLYDGVDVDAKWPGNENGYCSVRDVDMAWPCVNYMINHYRDEDDNLLYSRSYIQAAIWWFVDGDGGELNTLAQEAIENVITANPGWYESWIPSEGDWIAVLLDQGDGVQRTFIEVDP